MKLGYSRPSYKVKMVFNSYLWGSLAVWSEAASCTAYYSLRLLRLLSRGHHNKAGLLHKLHTAHREAVFQYYLAKAFNVLPCRFQELHTRSEHRIVVLCTTTYVRTYTNKRSGKLTSANWSTKKCFSCSSPCSTVASRRNARGARCRHIAAATAAPSNSTTSTTISCTFLHVAATAATVFASGISSGHGWQPAAVASSVDGGPTLSGNKNTRIGSKSII